ncbi:MAG: RsmD family RNA methyltransferase [Propionibacteriaceae bacterium]|jgi:16S rRNA (guanine966-N2)-methyltransferase|nr:RsmD family RNA methyltransferase [Propionibacteriaceae bacterium]
MTRIVAGRWASRRLATPAGAATRPTSDRVREAVFAHIAATLGTAADPPDSQLAGLTFLDLFAGSGAVGLEAASRGAASVTWVERDAATARLAERNRRDLGAPGLVVRADAATFAARPATGFDLVWLDPPYDLPAAAVDALIAQLAAGWLADQALLLVERSARSPAPTLNPDFSPAWARDYGETRIHLATWRPAA